jgi:hypothetical protein
MKFDRVTNEILIQKVNIDDKYAASMKRYSLGLIKDEKIAFSQLLLIMERG